MAEDTPKKTVKKTAVKRAAKKAPKKAAKKTTSTAPTYVVGEHSFVPQHEIVEEKEKKTLLDRYAANPSDFPKILITDAAIAHLSTKEGDLIKISRDSLTAGSAVFYRIVVNE